MNPALLKRLYKQKKKRAVDPNAPPRPTLLGQVKELKDAKAIVQDLQVTVQRLENRLAEAESQIRSQRDYLQALTQRMYSRR